MTTQEERIQKYHASRKRQERIDRAVKTARTYLRRAEDYLYGYRGEDGKSVGPTPPTYLYQELLETALDTSLAIIERLPDDYFGEVHATSFLDGSPLKYNLSDDLLEKVNKLLAVLDERRKAGDRQRVINALENTTGRTKEEAELYRRKAQELRDG